MKRVLSVGEELKSLGVICNAVREMMILITK